MIAPIFAHFAVNYSGGLDAGTSAALWIGLGIAISGAVLGVAIYLLGGARPQAADLDSFLSGASPAWYSPPLLAKLRRNSGAPVPITESGS